MFGLQLPHRKIQLPNPVFSYDVQQVRRLRTSESLTRYGRLLLLVSYCLLMLWWLYIIVMFAQPSVDQRWIAYQNFYSGIGVLWLAIPVVLPVAALILDVYSMAVTLNNIGHETSTGQLEMLRLTPLSANAYVAAKHSVAQIRAWRVLVVEVAVRMLSVVVIIIGFTFISEFYPYYVQIAPLYEITRSFKYHPLGTTALLITLLIFVIVYIAEPLWRMRVLTAIGLAISARSRNLPFASLAGFGAIVMFHLVQVSIIVALALFRRGFNADPGITWNCIIWLFGIVANTLFYHAIYSLAIRDTQRRVAQFE
jgi:hypothetical protein